MTTNTVYRPVADPTGSEANSGDHASCALRAAASILRTYAEPVGLSIPDNANNNQIADGINAYGHGWHATPTPWGDPKPQGIIAANIPLGHWVIVAVWCTGWAEPIPASQATSTTPSHWLAVYQANGTCFNCWEQTFPDYTNLDACYHGYGSVIVWHDEATPIPTPPTPKDKVLKIVYAITPANSNKPGVTIAVLSDGLTCRVITTTATETTMPTVYGATAYNTIDKASALTPAFADEILGLPLNAASAAIMGLPFAATATGPTTGTGTVTLSLK